MRRTCSSISSRRMMLGGSPVSQGTTGSAGPRWTLGGIGPWRGERPFLRPGQVFAPRTVDLLGSHILTERLTPLRGREGWGGRRHRLSLRAAGIESDARIYDAIDPLS
jgi:hypothetical protein